MDLFMRSRYTLLVCCVAAGLTACGKPASTDVALDTSVSSDASSSTLQVKIIHINDTHSQFDPSPAKVVGERDETWYTFIGGHPRLLSQAQFLREQAQQAGIPSLFLHGGDAFKGSAYFEIFEQTINIDILNRMQIDAMALGNHEFDIGLAKLADFASQINFPLLAANVNTQAEPQLADVTNLKPYQVFVLDGQTWQADPRPLPTTDNNIEGNAEAKTVRLAVFGLALEDMRSMVPDTGALAFEAEIVAAQRTVDALQQQGIQHIVALTHLGNQRDLNVAAKVNGIDVIVGGHSHSLLGDFRQWYLGQQGPYAQQVTNLDGKGVTCVVQAGQFAQAVGALTVSFNQQGEVTACEGENTLLASRELYRSALRQPDSQITGDALKQSLAYIEGLQNTRVTEENAVLRQVINEVYLPAVQQAYGAQISATERTISHVRLPGSGGSDQHGSALAGHIADAMHQWVNSAEVQPLLAGVVDMSLIGAGNIRSGLEAGAIYEGHIRLEVLPFDAPLSVLSVSGSDILALLHETISATLPAGAHAGKFPYTGNLRYTATEQADGTLQLTDVAVWRNEQWQALEPEQQYRIVTTNYLANGNDGWQRLQQVQQQTTDRQDLILLNGQPKAFAVNRVTAKRDENGQQAFQVEYTQGALPCSDAAADCKTAAHAMISYLRAQPTVWQQPRSATVTLLRQQ